METCDSDFGNSVDTVGVYDGGFGVRGDTAGMCDGDLGTVGMQPLSGGMSRWFWRRQGPIKEL